MRLAPSEKEKHENNDVAKAIKKYAEASGREEAEKQQMKQQNKEQNKMGWG